MKIAIIATGDEIVLGDVLNTNTQFIAQSLQMEGFPPDIHMACCDSEPQMLAVLDWLVPAYDMIIFIGGLGPTSDDKTRFAVCKFTKETLIEQKQAMEHIQSRLATLGLPMNEGNRQQALFPQNTQLFANPHGSALGGCYSWNNKKFILLPGPPRECIPMFNDYVLPLLSNIKPIDTTLLRWRLFAVPESVLGEKMDKALADLDCETGYRWDPPYVEFKVRAHASLRETIIKRVDPLVEPYIICDVEHKASDILREFINTVQENIVIEDKATGGLLQTLIQRRENHAFLTFNTTQAADWQITIEGLNDYWTGKEKGNMLTFRIHVQYKNKMLQETCEVPWFINQTLLYPAELACYKIVDLMQKQGA